MPEEPGGPEEMTVEELARRAQLPTTTVRMYQTRGLLPGPRREGRVGRYGPGHLARLRLIGRLQERGFSLAAIRQVVDTWEAGRSLDDLLGFEQRLPGLVPGELQALALDELAARFPPGSLDASVMERARSLGLVQAGEDGRVAVSRVFLEVGSALARLGVPPARLLDEQEALAQTMDAVAARFVAVFREHLWARYVGGAADGRGITDERLAEAAAVLEQLGELARRVVDESLRAALRKAAEGVVAEEARRVTG